MKDYERSRVIEWLEGLRGDMSQADLAADMTAWGASIGWSIDRSRYSKYESGSLPFGKTVLGNFIAYWASKDKAGPDLTPPEPERSLEERAVIAAEAQAAATAALVAELRAWRTEDRDRIAGQENLMQGVLVQLAQLGAAPVAPRAPRAPGQ